MDNEVYEVKEALGTITYVDSVIATIAGLAAIDVPGVAGMSGGFVSGMAEMLGRKNLTKGVKVEVTQKDVKCEINVIMEYGSQMKRVAEAVQEAVKNEIVTMAGLNVLSVNINVLGIKIDKDLLPGAKVQAEIEE